MVYLACGIYPQLQERKCEMEYWYLKARPGCTVQILVVRALSRARVGLRASSHNAQCIGGLLPDAHYLARRWNRVALAHVARHLHPFVAFDLHVVCSTSSLLVRSRSTMDTDYVHKKARPGSISRGVAVRQSG